MFFKTFFWFHKNVSTLLQHFFELKKKNFATHVFVFNPKMFWNGFSTHFDNFAISNFFDMVDFVPKIRSELGTNSLIRSASLKPPIHGGYAPTTPTRDSAFHTFGLNPPSQSVITG